MPPATPSRRQCADPADAEHRLWRRLRRGQLGERFARQVTLGPFVADFVCAARRLIVECDDSQHPCSPFDRARDARLAAAGWRVLRLRGDDILRDANAAAMTTRGLKESDMSQIVDMVDKALMNHDNEAVLKQIKGDVNAWVKQFPLYL